MDYISLEKNMRGFYYHREWESVNAFWETMKYQRDNENDEVEWAVCLNEIGNEVSRYRRGVVLIRKIEPTVN